MINCFRVVAHDIWVDNLSYNRGLRVASPPELHSDHSGLEVEGEMIMGHFDLGIFFLFVCSKIDSYKQ